MNEMNRDNTTSVIGMVFQDRCLYLLLALLGLLLFYPAVERGPRAQTLLLLLNSATLVAGVYAVSAIKRHVMIAVAIAVPQMMLTLVARFFGPHHAATWLLATSAIVLLIVFYIFTLIQVLTYVLRGTHITKDKIYGAVSVYLLVGLAWASAYALLVVFEPGSFSNNVAATSGGSSTPPDLLFFSFVTLTTLGYGDITPVTARARSLALLEAVTGVLYLAVLVARLVSAYRPEERSHEA
jgi:hypothetical protein